MDSQDLPRSLVPARQALARPLPGGIARPTSAVPDVAPAPQFLRITARGARRYWWLVLGIWIVGTAGLAAGIYYKVQPMYEAERYLQVELQQRSLFDGGTQDTSQLLETLVNLVKSPSVLQAAAADPKASRLPRIRFSDDVVLELRKSVVVRAITGTYLISVSMSSKDPYESAILVNAVVEAFLNVNRDWSDSQTKQQIAKLETLLKDLRSQGEDLEHRWKQIAAKGDVDSQLIKERNNQLLKDEAEDPDAPRPKAPVNRGTITIEQAKDVQRQLFQVNLDLVQAAAWVEEVRDVRSRPQVSDVDPDAVDREVERRFRADPEVVQLGEQLMNAQHEANRVRKQVRDGKDPALRRHMETEARLRTRYNEMWNVKSRQFRDTLHTRGADPDAELRDAEFKLKNLQVQKDALEAQMKDLRIASSRQATDEVDVALIREEWEMIKENQRTVQRKLEDLRFASKDGARVRSNDVASPAGRPVTDNRLKFYAMTPVGVLAAALAVAVLLELRSGRVSDPDLLSSRVRHEVFPIAPLPSIRAGEDPRSSRAEQKLARFVQSLDHLRVALCDGGVSGEGRCVLITSATGGEGKTTLSAHLAARCANAGTSILLIDADLRRASLGRLLDVPAGHGLADVLEDEVSLEDALITVEAGGFHFLSAGTPGRDPSRILSSPRLPGLIEQLRASYDLVLIDSPPILPVPDALLLGRYADGVVMASRFDASRLPLVERASRQLAAASIPVLGVVVNGARHQASEYGHYHYAYQYPNRNEDPRAELDTESEPGTPSA